MSIKVENVSYIYGKGTPFEKKAVDNVSFEIKSGEFIGLIGHTGSGKSTLIQLLNGLLKPDEGKIYINDTDITAEKVNMKSIRKDIGLVFQYPEYQLFEETVYKDISYGPLNFGMTKEQIAPVINEVTRLVGLDKSVLEKSPFELSGGQKRRVAIAGVLAMSPKILILDEPTAGLDPAGREEILNCIKRLHTEKNMTVILVSHSMEDIAEYADKILVMNKSELFCYDTAVKVFGLSAEIEKMGLDVPQITRVFNKLKERGIDLGKEVFTVNYAKDLVLKCLKEGRLS